MRLNLLTYNVGNRLAGPSRLADLLPRAWTDLVGLQELAASEAVVVAAELASLYLYQALAPAGFSGKGVLSRFPILSHEGLHLHPGRPDLWVMAELGGTPLQVPGEASATATPHGHPFRVRCSGPGPARHAGRAGARALAERAPRRLNMTPATRSTRASSLPPGLWMPSPWLWRISCGHWWRQARRAKKGNMEAKSG